MYTIVNVKTGEYVYGTNYRYSPHRQRTSKNQMLTYDNLYSAKADFLHRQCGKDYKIAAVTVDINRLVEPARNHLDVEYTDLYQTD